MISPERTRYLRTLSNDEWVDGLKLTNREFNRVSKTVEMETNTFCSFCKDPIELHQFVNGYNFGKGKHYLAKILNNPACEKATALKIYWLSGPEYFLQFANKESIPEFQKRDYSFIEVLEAMYLSGKYVSASVQYDPKPEAGRSDNVNRPQLRKLPKAMYKAVPQLSYLDNIKTVFGFDVPSRFSTASHDGAITKGVTYIDWNDVKNTLDMVQIASTHTRGERELKALISRLTGDNVIVINKDKREIPILSIDHLQLQVSGYGKSIDLSAFSL